MKTDDLSQFELDIKATKKDLIAQYKELLDAFRDKVAQKRELEKRLSTGGAQKAAEAVEVAAESTVSGVIDTVGQLRGLVASTLNDLTDKMSAQAEQLETYRRAIASQQTRLAELHDIEAAADTLAKLTGAYEERSAEAEAAFEQMRAQAEAEAQKRTDELESLYQHRADELEVGHKARAEALKAETERGRAEWKEEKGQYERDLDEETKLREQLRAREETEYVYERDRARKLESNEHQESVAAQAKELAGRKEAFEKELAVREAAIASRENRLDELEAEVRSFPAKLEKQIEAARKEASAAVRMELDQKAELARLEHAWEKKMLGQRIEHLEATIATGDQKIEQLRSELEVARKQVNDVATKAIEGASVAKAFHSVNEIALEQARRTDGKGGE